MRVFHFDHILCDRTTNKDLWEDVERRNKDRSTLKMNYSNNTCDRKITRAVN